MKGNNLLINFEIKLITIYGNELHEDRTAMTYFLCAENIFCRMLIQHTPSDILLDCHMALYSVSLKGIRTCTKYVNSMDQSMFSNNIPLQCLNKAL
jgi:hypothetical protein